jgi:hypothetical protein
MRTAINFLESIISSWPEEVGVSGGCRAIGHFGGVPMRNNSPHYTALNYTIPFISFIELLFNMYTKEQEIQ